MNFKHSTIDLLQIGDHRKEVARLRVPSRAEHAHEALRRTAKHCPEREKANRSVDILAQYRFPCLNISGNHAGHRLAQEGTSKLCIVFEVFFDSVAEFTCVCHRCLASLFVRLYSRQSV